MTKESYKRALGDARSELTALLNKRAELDEQIAKLRQSVASLSQLCSDSLSPTIAEAVGFSDIGLTEACREVLRASRQPFTVDEIKDGLIRLGYAVEGHSNIAASIHTTLKRMHDVEETTVNRKKAYRLRLSTYEIMAGHIKHFQR